MSDWKVELGRLFGGAVNQDTLEEAVDIMVAVSAKYPSYHELYLMALKGGVRACDEGDPAVMEAINRSGYRAYDLDQARELMEDFLDIYERTYAAATD